MALQPTPNGLPRLGLHFILAQTRQPVVCGPNLRWASPLTTFEEKINVKSCCDYYCRAWGSNCYTWLYLHQSIGYFWGRTSVIEASLMQIAHLRYLVASDFGLATTVFFSAHHLVTALQSRKSEEKRTQ
jgi:hypothetical protein